MKRMLAVAAALVAATVAAGSATAAAPSGLKLTPVKSTFPERSFLLNLPRLGSGVTPNVNVLENGKPVADIALTPTGKQAGRFGTVLVIDTSDSMTGQQLANAYAAARAFAGRRNGNQRLGVVTFDSRARVRLGLSNDGAAIARVLARIPETSQGTHIFDGISAALSIIAKAQVASASIVLLSDGADTGSAAGPNKTLARARALRVRIFSVGLGSPQFDPATLDSIASESGATYSEARSAADLRSIYDQLGYRLANEYLLQYKSFADPSQPVDVSVSVAGLQGAATSQYVSPALHTTVVPSAIHRSLIDNLMQSTLTMLVIVAIVAILLGFAASSLLKTGSSDLRRRLGAFVSVQDPATEEQDGGTVQTRGEPAKLTAWERFCLDIEIAEIHLAPKQIAILTLLATLIVIWIGSLVNLIVAFVGLLVPLLVRNVVKTLADRKKRLFGDQLPDNLQVLSSALRAGHSLIGALSVVVNDAPEPSQREFRQVVADEQVGVPLDDALRRVAERMSSRDLEQVALVAALQRETGGGAAEVLDRVADTVRDRAALRRLVRTLTAQGRMARWIVSGLPIGLLLVISVLNSEYMKPLFTKSAGQALIVFAGLMVIAGSFVIKKIIDIKV
jgi:tight adherence protein B